MRELRTVFQLLGMALGLLWWCASTVWIGVSTLWRTSVLASRFKAISAQVLLCPRGHEVPVYGLWDCHCGSRVEGWAFAPCHICHETAAYVPCPTCGLPVKNPTLL